jgi:hypothetical protein
VPDLIKTFEDGIARLPLNRPEQLKAPFIDIC